MVHRIAKSGSSSVLLLIIFWHHIFVAKLQRNIRAVILWHHSHDVRHPRKIGKWGTSSWCFRSLGLKAFFHFVKCPLYQNLSPTPMCHSQVSLVYTLHRNFTAAQHVMAQMLPHQPFSLLFMLNFDVWGISCTWKCRTPEQLRTPSSDSGCRDWNVISGAF